MMDGIDRAIAERLERAATEVVAGPPPLDTAGVIRTGVRRARARVAALAGAGLAVAVVLALIVAQLLPGGGTAAPNRGFDRGGSLPSTDLPSAAPPPQSAGSRPARTPSVLDPHPGSTPAAPSPSPPGSHPPLTACSPATAVPPPAGVSVTLTLDRPVLRAGEELSMAVRVRNEGATPASYQRSGQRYDFWVDGPDGTVWVWSWGGAFEDPLVHETMAQGQEHTATEVWDQSRCAEGGVLLGPTAGAGRPPAGTYRARALWKTIEGGWWSDPVEFVVV